MSKIFTAIICFLFSFNVGAQTFQSSDNPSPITDIPTVNNDFTINVSELAYSTLDTVFGLESVCINIQHNRNSDLDIFLIAPNGKTVELVTDCRGNASNFTNTCFTWDSSVTDLIERETGPFSGNYLPEEILGKVNDGQNGNGTWTLRIIDDDSTSGGTGNLINWSLTFSKRPARNVHLTSSNLPIVVLQTHGNTISDEPKVIVNMGIIYNGPGLRNKTIDPFLYFGKIGIEYRGSTSQKFFNKKPYGFETRDTSGTIDIETSLLGMPAESDWILSSAFSDKTQFRNMLSFFIYNQMGHYASRTLPCELVIDGQYRGIYVLMEKIKRNKNRVNISKLESSDTIGDEVTGGYIFKLDKTTGGDGGKGWKSQYSTTGNPPRTILYQYHYPQYEDIQPRQAAYIKSFTDSFEIVMAGSNFADPVNGYSKYIDVSSFIDFIILTELNKNPDGYRISTFLYKDKNSKGGKLKIGPPWDYDLAWDNADFCDSDTDTGWAYTLNSRCPAEFWQIPFWVEKLMQDTRFTDMLRCRWDYLRKNILDEANLYSTVDSFANLLDEAQARNYWMWRVIGQYVWPQPYPIPKSYQEEVDRVKQWIGDRILWIDNNLPAQCSFPAPIADFSANSDSTICAGNSVSFMDQSLFPTNWLWNFEGGSPPSSTTQTPLIYYTTPGTYSVSLNVSNTTGSDTAIKIAYITVISCTDINEQSTIEGLKVFPNPATEKVIIHFTVKSPEKITLRLVNTLSEIVYEESIEHFSGDFKRDLDLQRLSKGVYFLEIRTNEEPVTIKLVHY